MKKTLLTLFALTTCATLNAQSILERKSLLGTEGPMLNISLDTRFDLRYSETDGSTDYSNFEAKVLRALVTGEIVPGVRYAWRQLINRPSTAMGDNSGAGTNYLWVAFDAGRKKNWTITAGKQTVKLGTYEFNYNAADLYLQTMVNGDFDFYRIGVNTAYTFAPGQTFNLQIMNAGSQMTTPGYSSKGLAAAFLWEGSFLDNAIGTRIGYSAWQHRGKDIYNWFSGGVQGNIGVLTTELDFYYGDRYMDYSGTVATRTGQHQVRDMSAGANFKFNFGKLRPSIKGVWDRRRDMELKEDAYGNLGIQAVLEFFPFTKELLKGLRFHVMYSYRDTSFDGPFSGMDNRATHTALVGMRWLMKVK